MILLTGVIWASSFNEGTSWCVPNPCFDGFLVSDWEAVEFRNVCKLAGTCVCSFAIESLVAIVLAQGFVA